ncbi:MAG: hypothetical protein ACAI35_26170 [Candidatus Methylacidiphilales bacterium]|nr:hypothetical protein [Candidatus Methylacidiphilales bacterium]
MPIPLIRSQLTAKKIRHRGFRRSISGSAPVEAAAGIFAVCFLILLALIYLKLPSESRQAKGETTGRHVSAEAKATAPQSNATNTEMLVDLGQPVLRLPVPRDMPPAPPEKTVLYPIEDLRPGMRGVTYTVLQGSKIVPVDTEILGVVKNGLGPNLDIIIGKLVDPKTALTEAVHGMSGSPLYVDGKLVGALSRRIASFEKDGHCGFTPINDMLDVDKRVREDGLKDGEPRKIPAASPGAGNTDNDPIVIMARARQILGLRGSNPFLPADQQLASGSVRTKSVSNSDSGTLSGADPSSPWKDARFEQLAIPLSVSGASAATVQTMQRLMEASGLDVPAGLVATPGGAPTESSLALGPESLTPGAPVATFFMTGSISLNAVGTLTWRDGNNVLGFGHPMMSHGHTDFPMGTAEIVTTIPSYARPFKMASPGQIVGTVTEDRFSAIGGVVGPKPVMAKYRIRRIHKGVERPVLEGEFLPNPNIVPTLLGTAIQSAVTDRDDISRVLSVRTSGEFRAAGLPPVQLGNAYAGEEAELNLGALRTVLPVMLLYNSKFGDVEAQSLDVLIETTEEPRVFVFESLTADTNEVEPGGKIRVTTTFRERFGDRTTRTFDVTLPPQIKSGTTILLRVGSGALFDELAWSRALGTARSLTDVVTATVDRRMSNHLVLQLITGAPGEIIQSQELPSLPSSVMDVMRSGNTNAQHTSLPDNVWSEQSIEFPGTVEGGKELQISVK